MNHKSKTKLLTKEEALSTRRWFLIDAKGKTLGRFAAEVARILTGKHRTDYTPHVDMGDGVVIINAAGVVVTGNKEATKVYRHYTGYMSGLKEIPYREMKKKNPDQIIVRAVSGMMPKTRLGSQQIKKLHVFAGEAHTLQAQKPIPVNV